MSTTVKKLIKSLLSQKARVKELKTKFGNEVPEAKSKLQTAACDLSNLQSQLTGYGNVQRASQFCTDAKARIKEAQSVYDTVIEARAIIDALSDEEKALLEENIY